MILFNSKINPMLSNFAEVDVTYEGETYPTVEHAYQASKTTDELARKRIQKAPRAADAKRLGRTVILDASWDRKAVMLDLLTQKFRRPDYRQVLLNTGNSTLRHYCPWGDTFWGVNARGFGRNTLGLMLIDIRENIRADKDL